MPATALPSSGDNPGDRPSGNNAINGSNSSGPRHAAETPQTPKTCDASGMADIHRMFRAGFGEGPELVNSVTPNDAAQADIVGDYLAMLSTTLHGHHQGEDTLLWDNLESRAPSCAIHVERMKVQHAEMLVHLDELDARLPTWRASGRMEDAASVLAALAGINAALDVHMPDEEATIVPVMETTLAPADVNALSKHGRKSTPKGKTFIQLGAILDAQPDGGDAWMHKNLPAPVRVIWRLVGKSRYEKYRAELVK